MANESELKVRLTAEAAQFISGINAASGSLSGFARALGTWQTGAIAVGTAMTGIIKSTADYGSQLHNTSQKIGVSVEALSGLQYAAKIADVDNEQLATGLKKLNRNLFDFASGAGEAKAAFMAMGISALDNNGNLRLTEDVLLEVADKFSRMKDEATKSALAQKLFGRSGAELIPLLNEGKDGIDKLTAEAGRLGLVMSKEAAQAADNFNDQIDKITGTVKGLSYEIGTPLIQALNDAIGKFGELKDSGFLSPAGAFKSGNMLGQLVPLNAGTLPGSDLIDARQGTLPGFKKLFTATIANEDEEKRKKKEQDEIERMYQNRLDGEMKVSQLISSELIKRGEWYAAYYDAEQAFLGSVQENLGKAILENHLAVQAQLKDGWANTLSFMTGQTEGMSDKEIELAGKRSDAVTSSYRFITASALKENKAMFQIMKAVDIAQATMDTYTAAMKAWSQLGAFGGPVAALIVAAGMANVAKIASTPFGGGGGGAGGAVPVNITGQSTGATGAVPVTNTPNVTIIVQGNIVDHDKFVRELRPYFGNLITETI